MEFYGVHATTQAMTLTLWLSMPPIIVAIIVGLCVSLILALTQIQEQTLSFGVKLVAVTLSLIGTAMYLGDDLYQFAHHMFIIFPEVTR
ncbi:type III secretion system export apparatus subunit SctS [Desulfovibrio inopinatus]|uniref:type III secretion system export apparatus subunit SctS n=1 Tax=Desulfovibrio inopinatus TaxID=102109 RepID=UPI00041A4EC5|nr:type III secretion system export apparatus subunit SctS [Desulfovibrio inopinatus]